MLKDIFLTREEDRNAIFSRLLDLAMMFEEPGYYHGALRLVELLRLAKIQEAEDLVEKNPYARKMSFVLNLFVKTYTDARREIKYQGPDYSTPEKWSRSVT